MAVEFPAPVLGEPYSYPLPHPSEVAKTPPARPALTADQADKLNTLLEHFNKDGFALPNTLEELKLVWRIRAGPAKGLSSFWSGKAPTEKEMPPLVELNEVEKCYWSTEAFQRCLRAVRWNAEAGLKRAEETAVWRREFGVDGMPDERVSREGETGKELVFGYDNLQRPVLYMHPYRQNTETGPSQIDFVVWCLERTIDLCPATVPATEMLCLCIDFGANRNEKRPPTSLGQAKKVLHILQTYYCERLGKAVCANVPGYFAGFYALVGPFIDPITREKIKFLNGADATELIPPAQLQSIFHGEVDFEYDHATYFPALSKLCAERREANLARWRKYGEGKCGLEEAVIRGAVTPDGEKGDAALDVTRETAEVEKPADANQKPTALASEVAAAEGAPAAELAKGVEDIKLGEAPAAAAETESFSTGEATETGGPSKVEEASKDHLPDVAPKNAFEAAERAVLEQQEEVKQE